MAVALQAEIAVKRAAEESAPFGVNWRAFEPDVGVTRNLPIFRATTDEIKSEFPLILDGKFPDNEEIPPGP